MVFENHEVGAAYFCAAGMLALLIVNIRNSWDLMLTMVRRATGR